MAYQSITNFTSPNQSSRGGARISSITIHHWGVKGQKFQNVVNYLCRPGGTSSAHYVVEDGRVACIVAPGRRAWHSGNNVGNDTSIGIECRPEATDGDYATVAELVRNLRATYGDLPLQRHSDWKNTACPGAWDLARIDRLARATPTAPTAPAGAANKEDDDMALYLVGDKAPEVYALDTATGLRRYVSAKEYNAIVAAGVTVRRIPQARLDALPKVAGSR